MAAGIYSEQHALIRELPKEDKQKIFQKIRGEFVHLGITIDENVQYTAQSSRKLPNIISIHMNGDEGQRFSFERIPLYEVELHRPSPRNLIVHEENIVPLAEEQYLWQRSSLCIKFTSNDSPEFIGHSNVIAQIDGNLIPIQLRNHLPAKFIAPQYIVPGRLIERSMVFHRAQGGWLMARFSDSEGKTLADYSEAKKIHTFEQIKELSGIQFP